MLKHYFFLGLMSSCLMSKNACAKVISLSDFEEFIISSEAQRIHPFLSNDLEEDSRDYALTILKKSVTQKTIYYTLSNELRQNLPPLYYSLLENSYIPHTDVAQITPDPTIRPDPALAFLKDGDLQKRLGNLNIIAVPSLRPGHKENPALTAQVKKSRVEIPTTFNPREYSQGGNEDSCIFLSTIASIMYTKAGRDSIKNLLVGQDETSVYFKFDAPDQTMIANMSNNMPDLIKMAQDAKTEIEKSVFKVPRNIIETAAYRPSYPRNLPHWLHLLMRAYHTLVLRYRELFWWIPNQEERFSEILPTMMLNTQKNDTLYFSPLVGKELSDIAKNEYQSHAAKAAELKKLITSQNIVRFATPGHSRSMLVDENAIYSHDVQGGVQANLPGFSNLKAMNNDLFLEQLFNAIERARGSAYFEYFTKPLQ